MPTFEDTFRQSAEGVASLGCSAADVASLDDASLLAAQDQVGAHRRHTDTIAAWIAAEIAHRSRYELGYAGLAQRNGFLSPEALIQAKTNIGRTEAVKLVSIGTMMAETEAAAALVLAGERLSTSDSGDIDDGVDPASTVSASDGHETVVDGFTGPASWQSPIAAAVTTGLLTLDAADILRRVFSTVEAIAPPEQLRDAVRAVVADATVLNADQLYRRARQVRDRLDTDGIARRETERHDARYLKMWQQPDGMYRGSWQLDPENGRLVAAAFENILSPRRGGPRFIDAADQARAQALIDDERTTTQIAADALVDIVRLAIDTDPGTLFGSRTPAVRIVVTQNSLHARRGHGTIEGHTDPVSMETVERHLCNTGGIPIGFDDDGQCINVGRTKRLFTQKQRIGLAVRDNGCRINGCDRPPSMCEAHHIDQWARDHGDTNLEDGILLCRRHHMLLHNNHWDIIRDGADYWLRPPTSVDQSQELIFLPSTNALLDRPPQLQHAS